MGRLFGSVLILAGCAGVLLGWREGERKRQAMMEECIRLFSQWSYSVKREHIRLLDFWRQYTPQQPQMGEFLEEVTQMLLRNCYPTGQEVWREVIYNRRKTLMLRGEALVVLQEAGDAFFGNNSMESLRCMEVCRERMEQCLAASREEFLKKQRVYMPSGMLGGMILIILLV